MLILSIGNAAFDIFRFGCCVCHPTFQTAHSSYQFLCKGKWFSESLWEVLACYACYPTSGYRCYTNSPKKTGTENGYRSSSASRYEDGNDPWFAVFRLMTKEDLHKSYSDWMWKKSWSSTLQGNNISLLKSTGLIIFSQFCAAGCFFFANGCGVSRRYLCIFVWISNCKHICFIYVQMICDFGLVNLAKLSFSGGMSCHVW